MKTRESGMPDETTWTGFFDPVSILTRLGLTAHCRDVVEFGCGYGTFTIPAARIARGTVHAIDIDPAMIEATRTRAATAGLSNVRTHLCDFVEDGTGLPTSSADYAMLFNILHAEQPVALLREAHRVLTTGGQLSIIHWIHDASTPRGPSMDIRPRPDQCQAWAQEAGFTLLDPGIVDLPPYHYGMVLQWSS
jgi:ubiquinone/menaquinone biosynthesis C-methylase UbiE